MTKDSAEGEREVGLECLLKVTKDFAGPLLYLSFSLAKRTVVTLETRGSGKGICHRTRGDSTQTPNTSSVHSQVTNAIFPGISLPGLNPRMSFHPKFASLQATGTLGELSPLPSSL